MGLFDGLFGKQKGSSSANDGQWLENERDANWIVAFDYDTNTGKQFVEISTDSCCQISTGYHCIIRIKNMHLKEFYYALCFNDQSDDIEMLIFATRIESFDGKVNKKDEWTKGDDCNCFSVETNKDVSKAIAIMRNHARFNNYSSPPLYAIIAARMLS